MDMGRGMEVEDDLFFADLSKRISLLISEEEEEFPEVSIQGYSHAPLPFFAPPPFLGEAAVNYRSSTKGTGVFFPRSSLPNKKKSRQGRSRLQGEKARSAASIIHPSTTAASKKQHAKTTAT